MTDVTERPKLRPGLAAARDAEEPSRFVLWDRNRLTHTPVRLTECELDWAQLFDGRTELREVQLRVMRQNGGGIVAVEAIAALVKRLDAALLLDSPRFFEYITGPVRMPSCVGCYDADPDRLREQLEGLFTAPGGPGLPSGPPPDSSSVRAVLVPHMDYARGGVTYGWGFKDLFEKTAAKLFVIIATSHYSGERYTLTRQHFQTPLGLCETDHAFLDRLEAHYGDGLYDDPFAHLPEHSIELEVVLLQYLYERHRPFRIVPLLVGSFGDAVHGRESPAAREDVARMVNALRQAEAETPEEVCYVISGDLAHIGPKFRDPEPVNEQQMTHSRSQDEAILKAAEAADPAAYFRVIADEGDCRRICGLPPTWTTLAAARPSRGRVLHYNQFVHPKGYESVSFASVAFDR
jgi:AmmeMemoRadiSam system protein B